MRLTAATAAMAAVFCAAATANAQDATATQNQGSQKSGGIWSKLTANAKYQQAKQNGASPTELAAIKSEADGGSPAQSSSSSKDSKKKHLCNINDEGASLQPDGSWAGPNCITSDGNGHAKNAADMKDDKSKDSGDAQEKRAADMESHSCMTTDGADKATALAADCQKVADHPDKACNIQQNSCDDIRKATQKGCWGKAAEGPDWCLTRYN